MTFMHMKKILYAIALAMLVTPALWSCGSDNDFADVDGKDPVLTLTTNHIQTEIGRQFTIKGVAQDNDGLKSIRIVNADLQIDKTIDLLDIYGDSLLTSYDLAYNVKTAKTQQGDKFPFDITVTDVGGRTVETTELVTMDGDFTPPTFTKAPDKAITVLLKNTTTLNLHFTAADNKALKYVKVSIPEIQFSDSVAASGTSFNYANRIALPSMVAAYTLTITAADQFDLTVSNTSQVNVSEMPDFKKMYLADVDSAMQLNTDLYGVPMLIEHTGAYSYRARYYNQKAGTQIRFIPQKTDFEPICFSADPSNTSVLTDDPYEGQPIVLNEANKYYEITFNTKTGAYNVSTFTPNAATLPIGTDYDYGDGSGSQTFQICLAGSGLPGASSWTTNPNNKAFILKQDATNPYLLYADMKLEAGDKVAYTISATHVWGWWPEPYWRFDKSGENEYNVKNGGDNMTEVTVPTSGKYRMEFDYFLLRSRIIPDK
jgi:plastocyanin